MARVELEKPFQLDVEEFALLSQGRRGATVGPSGMTSDQAIQTSSRKLVPFWLCGTFHRLCWPSGWGA